MFSVEGVHQGGVCNCYKAAESGLLILFPCDVVGFREDRQSLTLLELPSIFIPEDWSFTFFEGINRLPESVFKDRDVAELGCGNGWISIALAEKWSPRKVMGFGLTLS